MRKQVSRRDTSKGFRRTALMLRDKAWAELMLNDALNYIPRGSVLRKDVQRHLRRQGFAQRRDVYDGQRWTSRRAARLGGKASAFNQVIIIHHAAGWAFVRGGDEYSPRRWLTLKTLRKEYVPVPVAYFEDDVGDDL